MFVNEEEVLSFFSFSVVAAQGNYLHFFYEEEMLPLLGGLSPGICLSMRRKCCSLFPFLCGRTAQGNARSPCFYGEEMLIFSLARGRSPRKFDSMRRNAALFFPLAAQGHYFRSLRRILLFFVPSSVDAAEGKTYQ